ncbi:MAG: ABC transporter permease [Alicyclobacillus sp.]|nr:ABC transporter permease [Alicyclobacillus sp.]
MTAALIRTALRSLGGNMLRTILTLLGIVIGVAAVVTLMSLGQATTANVTNRIQGLGTNLLVVTPGQITQDGVSQGLGSAQTLSMTDVQHLQKAGYPIVAVAPDETTRAQIAYGDVNTQTTVEGSTPDLYTVRNLQLAFGRFFNLAEVNGEGNVAVIGPATAENLWGNINPVGRTVWVNGIPFTIVGELTSQGSSGPTNNDDRLIIPITTLQTDFTGNAGLSAIYVSAANSNQMALAQRVIERTMRNSHGLTSGQDDFVITNQANLLSTLQGVSESMQRFLGGIAGISLLVGGIGIMNIMLVSVTERTREIGLRKALGATRRDVLGQFLVESTLVGLLGGGIGIMIGIIATQLLDPMLDSATSIDFQSVWVAFVVALMVGVVFGLYPAIRASRLTPIHALRYE